MTERELGAALSLELRAAGWKVFKLHNDAMQVGLPDYLLWHDGGPLLTLELKRALTAHKAQEALTPGQRSVLESLARTERGTLLVYGDRDTTGMYSGGILVLRSPGRGEVLAGTTRADLAHQLALGICRLFPVVSLEEHHSAAAAHLDAAHPHHLPGGATGG